MNLKALIGKTIEQVYLYANDDGVSAIRFTDNSTLYLSIAIINRSDDIGNISEIVHGVYE